MNSEARGPALERLTRRLAETPEDFLHEPRIGSSGSVHVAAVVQDLLSSLGSTAIRTGWRPSPLSMREGTATAWPSS